MDKKVPPLNVSPIIKSSRYICLILGIVYGMTKLGTLRTYEATAKRVREKMYQEQHAREHEELLKIMREELRNLVIQLELTDVPPGWEQDIE